MVLVDGETRKLGDGGKEEAVRSKEEKDIAKLEGDKSVKDPPTL